jgi:hypothetical protein
MSSGAVARRNYGAAKQEAPRAVDDERTSEELLQEIEKLDKEDVAATRRMVALASETRDLAANTAATLKDQGEQIERTTQMLTSMDESLKGIGGRLGLTFGWKRKKKEKAMIREIANLAPTGSVKGPAPQASGISGRSSAPASLLQGTWASTPVAGSSSDWETRNSTASGTASVRPSSSRRAPGYRPGPNGAASEAAQAEIDNNLDMINSMVLEMKEQATEMGQELEKQNGSLERLDLQVSVNSVGVQSATKAISGRNWVGGLKKVEGKMKYAAASLTAGSLL